MFPANFISVERISTANQAASKKRILEEVAGLLATASEELTQGNVFDKLLERERLGSTGLGHGIALPHARVAGIAEARGAFIQLQKGADFDAIDQQPVDLVFGLLVPEEATEAHLQLLAKLATLFSDADFCARLRQAQDSETLLNEFLLIEPMRKSASA
ncbi:PTS sugar transporter subunit IIA [Sedimenticola selenatireducens]|jgi:PTS system nitrogen regulatory IIA component|uniref:PTS sugar transporter subunit IIA n=1 Tax=Sedimenticola selenatireducens TaxID=191960 RepID=A0A558DXH7_9GAMM|nr:PTS sugar transporter subunit IIA [Sedimenticola selenatireducens]TVO70918.1 PTS sugar transporter subunit IIA [Sedimenticola selenatireducens]TVT65784.1 MAG: PTS sugar transporter subunit IIA [Sedimenticola selenatireducens]